MAGSDVTNKELIRLIGGIRNKDRRSLEQLFNLFAPRLQAYAIARGCQPNEAEDIVQEVMLAVWQKSHLFDIEKASVSTWLFTLVRNKRIDFYRKEKSGAIISHDLWQEKIHEASGTALEDENQNDLDSKNLRIMINNIPPEQRQVLYKMYFEGKSHIEISKEMSLPLGTVKSRIRLAISKLEQKLKDKLYG